MTFSEKNIILAALVEYEKAERRREKTLRNRGEDGKADEHIKNACIASGLASTWAAILSEPAGSVKI